MMSLKIELDVEMDQVYDLSMVLLELEKQKIIKSFKQMKEKQLTNKPNEK